MAPRQTLSVVFLCGSEGPGKQIFRTPLSTLPTQSDCRRYFDAVPAEIRAPVEVAERISGTIRSEKGPVLRWVGRLSRRSLGVFLGNILLCNYHVNLTVNIGEGVLCRQWPE